MKTTTSIEKMKNEQTQKLMTKQASKRKHPSKIEK
jgi:hypothetical protein